MSEGNAAARDEAKIWYCKKCGHTLTGGHVTKYGDPECRGQLTEVKR